MKITEIVEDILKRRKWALYDKQDPIEKLPVSGETPLFKVNEVEMKYLLQDIELAIDEEERKWSQEKPNLGGGHQNTSQIG